MFASRVNPIITAFGNGTKRPKTRPSETAPYRDRLSTIIILRESGNVGSVGPWVLAQGAFKDPLGLRGPCPFSRTERLMALRMACVAAGLKSDSGIVAWGSLSPGVVVSGPLGGAPWRLT